MDFKHKQLEQDLTALSRTFSELGARLAEVAKEVTAPGVIPSEKLLEQISVSRMSFEKARNSVHGHAGAMLVSPLPKLEDLMSIAAIDGLLKASAVAEETKFSVEGERERALAILGRVLSIFHREISDFKALQECHAKVGELRNGVGNVHWPHRHPESDAIVSSKHPTTALLQFVENLDKLDDDSWMTLETTITDNYGKPLFVAASRGKLAVRQEGRTEATKPSAAPPPAKAPASEPAKPAAAAEKPVERKIVAEQVQTERDPLRAPADRLRVELAEGNSDAKLNKPERELRAFLELHPGSHNLKDLEAAIKNVSPAARSLARKGLVALKPETLDVTAGAGNALWARHVLNPTQQAAFDRIREAIEARRFQTFLLHGVTGSGKTEVYLTAIETVLGQGRSGDVGGQLVQRQVRSSGPVILTPPSHRHTLWQRQGCREKNDSRRLTCFGTT